MKKDHSIGSSGIYQYTIENLSELNDFEELFKGFKKKWLIFRGQSNSNWHIHSSLERHIVNKRGIPYFRSTTSSLSKEKYKEEIMKYLRANFSSEFSKHSDPDIFAYLQHYGSYTQLVDFTWNFTVAQFFCLYHNLNTDAAIWIIVLPRLRGQDSIKMTDNESCIKQYMDGIKFETENEIFLSFLKGLSTTNSVSILPQPHLSCKRQERQDGLFLFPTNNDASFEENLFDLKRSKKQFNNGSFTRLLNQNNLSRDEFKKKIMESEGDESNSFNTFKINIPKHFLDELSEIIKFPLKFEHYFPQNDEDKSAFWITEKTNLHLESIICDFKAVNPWNKKKP